MTENNKEKDIKPEPTRYCYVVYRQLDGTVGHTVRHTIQKAKMPLNMDEYDSSISYNYNLEYFVHGLVDAGFIIVNDAYIPWHNIEQVLPCKDNSDKSKSKKKTGRKPRRKPQPKPQTKS